MNYKSSKTKHLLKSLTWRVISIIITTCISWFITGDIKLGLAIGSIDALIKMYLYYVHERLWHKHWRKN